MTSRRFATILAAHPVALCALGILILSAVGSFYQVNSGLFHCGNWGAGDEIWYWSAAAALQSLLFLCSGWHKGAQRIYRASQWLALPVVLFILYQLSAVHARPLLLCGVAMIVGAFLMRGWAGMRGEARPPIALQHFQQAGLFLMAWLVIHSAFALLVLYSHTMMLSDTVLVTLLVTSALAAFFVVRHGLKLQPIAMHDCAPLLLLAMILLRAKFPDGAYDSLFYKSTVPEMLADWRTARTGLPDHTLLGTNFQEIMISQLRMVDAGFQPAFMSTLACLGLWLLTPLASRMMTAWRDPGEDVRLSGLFGNAATLLIVSQSEVLIAAGTSYQEPLQVLYLVAGLLAGPAGLLFLSAAVAIKITALFFIPILLLIRLGPDAAMLVVRPHKWLEVIREWAKHGARPASENRPAAGRAPKGRLVLMLCVGIALLVFGEQLARNQLLAGRVLAPSETLASVTDPSGRILTRVGAEATFDAGSELPWVDTVVATLIHIGTLDRWLRPDEKSFHVFPSSRVLLVAMLLSLVALWGMLRIETRRWSLLVLGYAVLYLVFLKFFLQGRHMAAASFAAIPLIASLPLWRSEPDTRPAACALFSIAIAALAIGDQVVGNFINVGWSCERKLLAPARNTAISPVHAGTPGNDATHEAQLQAKLNEIVALYRMASGGNSRVIPSILCDPQMERKLYTGAHYVYAIPSHLILRRLIGADPERLTGLDQAALVVCASSWGWMGAQTAQLAGFDEVGQVGTTRLFVSRRLMAGDPARQLRPAGFPIPGHRPTPRIAHDLARDWRTGQLADRSPQQTPTGIGVLEMQFMGGLLPALVSANTLSFSGLKLFAEDRVVIEAAIPFTKSDGLRMELVIEAAGLPRVSRRIVLPGPKSETEPLWRSIELEIPSKPQGPATISVTINSEGGDPEADWIVIRKLQVQRTPDF